jgi:hypothetical protein
MLRKICVCAVFLLLVYAMPAGAAVKVEWDATAGGDDANSELAWRTGFTASGDWSLGPRSVFFLKNQIAIDQADEEWQGKLERCYIRYEQGPVRLNLGRQGVSWGIGWFFRPTDLVTPLTPLAREETRPGKDLAVLRWSTSALTAVDFIAGAEMIGARSEWRIGPTNLRLLGVYQPGYIRSLGFDFQGGLAGFYGEGAYHWAGASFDQGELAGLVGWRKVLRSGNQLYLEYYRNDLSKAGPELAALWSENKNRELRYSNQNYLAVGLQIPWDQLTTCSITAIANLDDGGVILQGIADVQLSDNLTVRGALMTVAGAGGAEFRTRVQGAKVGATVEMKYFF